MGIRKLDLKYLKESKLLWFSISTSIIVGMIYFADIDRFIESLQSADPLLLIPALILGLAVFPTWSYVWYRVFRTSGINVSYRKAVRIFMAGNFMNAITPLGQFGGEPIMAYLVRDNSDSSYEKAISSVFSADIMNAAPQITFIIGGAVYVILFKSALNQAILQAMYIAVFATIIGGIFVYLLWFEAGTIEGKILSLIEKISDPIGRGENLVEAAEEKLEAIEESFRAIGDSPRYLLETAVVAHVGFLFLVFNFYFIMASLGFTPDISPIYFVVVLAGLANFSPTPGGSGTYEAAMAGLVTVFFAGTSFATGLTIAILFRLSTYWPGLLLGWLAFNHLQNGGAK